MKVGCDLLVSLLFVVCAAIAWFVIIKKCKAGFIDVERWAYNEKETVASGFDYTYRWYAFRLSSVILVIGGFTHGHRIGKMIWDRLY